eukprot:COSAG01_NODE_2234_length_8097_cov_5.001500_8_plen_82_part_00
MDCNGAAPPLHHVATNFPGAAVPTHDKANEFFLFHGLNHSFIDKIARFGMDPRYSSTDGMFGAVCVPLFVAMLKRMGRLEM